MGWGIFGGGSTSSSSNQTTNNTETKNTSGGADNGAFQISSSGDVTLQDPKAVEDAFKFASQSLGLATTAVTAAQNQAAAATAQTASIAQQQNSGGSQNMLIGLSIAAVVIIFLFRK